MLKGTTDIYILEHKTTTIACDSNEVEEWWTWKSLLNLEFLFYELPLQFILKINVPFKTNIVTIILEKFERFLISTINRKFSNWCQPPKGLVNLGGLRAILVPSMLSLGCLLSSPSLGRWAKNKATILGNNWD